MNKIPNNFLWGASTSAYQLEGGASEDGKGISIQDLAQKKEGVTDFSIATDHYHKWKEDIALMKEMGFKSYRFSISWTRIYPNGNGKVNQKGIDFYNKLIDELVKNKIEPIVTIFHFDMPLELQKQGGWANRKLIVDSFVNYSKTLFENFGDRVKYWLTINEQNMMIMFGHIMGLTKVEKGVDPFKDLYQQNHYMMVAQAKVIDMYHTEFANQKGKIGPAPNIGYSYPKDCNPKNYDASYKTMSIRNWLYLDCLTKGGYNKVAWNWFEENGYTPKIEKGDLELFKRTRADFIAFNYYATSTVEIDDGSELKMEGSDQQFSYDLPGVYKVHRNQFLEHTEFGWEVDPEGFLHTCRVLNDRYNLPIIITENGLGAYDVLTDDGKIHDQYRIDFLKEHIKYIPQILSEGIQLIGFNPWSAIDLVSTHEGLKKRYGFIYVDANDDDNGSLKRYKKDSFFWYKDVIASNGEKL